MARWGMTFGMAALAAMLLTGSAMAGKDNLVVELTQEPASLDPHGHAEG